MTSIRTFPLHFASLVLALALGGCDSKSGDGHSGHDDHGPPGASGDEVSLTAEQVKAAGIRSQPVGPGAVTERLSLTAVVKANLDAQAHLTPKVPGLVRSVRKHLGDRVEAGEILCELESTVFGEATSHYREARATLQAARGTLKQETALLARSVQVAQKIYERERKLKADAITTMRPYYEAEKALAQAQLSRDRRILALQSDLRQREILLHTAEEKLRILGLKDADLKKLEQDKEHGHGRYPLLAPRSGVIVARDLTESEFVDTSSKLFLIQDLRRVWVVGSVYEGDLRRVERGQRAIVRLQAFPGRAFRGKVTLVDYHIDPTTRACEVRVELPNEPVPGWKEPFPLRPGLFGTVDLVLKEQQVAIAVPEAAIVHEGEKNYVFVALGPTKKEAKHDEHKTHDDHDEGKTQDDHDEGKTHDDHDEGPSQRFVRREVVIGARGAKQVEIKSGLKQGDRVVVEGTFTLKSAARQGELGGGHSH